MFHKTPLPLHCIKGRGGNCQERNLLFRHLVFDKAHDSGQDAATANTGKYLGDHGIAVTTAAVEHFHEFATPKAANEAGYRVEDGTHIDFFEKTANSVAASGT